MIYRVDVHWYTKYFLNKSTLYKNCKKGPHISSLKNLCKLKIRAILHMQTDEPTLIILKTKKIILYEYKDFSVMIRVYELKMYY